MKIFVDTNVLLDTIVPRQDKSLKLSSGLFLSLRDQKDYELCVSTISLSTCAFYLKDNLESISKIKILTKGLTILDTLSSDFTSALSSGEKDIEDAMQFSVASRSKCDLIATRDKSGFLKSPVPFMTPSEILSRIEVIPQKNLK